MDNFTEIPFTVNNLDRYYVRHSIFNAIKEFCALSNGNLLDIGCGKMPYKKYILANSKTSNYVGLDIEHALTYDNLVKPDFTWDGKTMPFENEQFDCAFGTEVLEHCPEPELILEEIMRILKPGGMFFFTVPFLWPLHEVPHDEYRYTPWSVMRHLHNAGFSEIEIKSLGGWNAALAQMMGLWVKRSGISGYRKRLISAIFKPTMRYLFRKDQPESNFKESTMITGLYGFAKKSV